MCLLLTRPREDSEAFAEKLAALGHRAVIAPMMEIVRCRATIDLTGVQALLATSANGIRAFADACSDRSLAVFAVGPQTANCARDAGFEEVVSANGNSADLAALASQRLNPANGRLLHAAGSETAGGLSQTLRARAFAVDTVVLYRAEAVKELPLAGRQALAGRLDGVMLFSPRSAAIFAELVSGDAVASNCQRMTAYCISSATAEALSPLKFLRVVVAAMPNQDAMLGLLSR